MTHNIGELATEHRGMILAAATTMACKAYDAAVQHGLDVAIIEDEFDVGAKRWEIFANYSSQHNAIRIAGRPVPEDKEQELQAGPAMQFPGGLLMELTSSPTEEDQISFDYRLPAEWLLTIREAVRI